MAKGFTLVELLICLTIVGELATFAVPKLINAQQNKQYNSIAKEGIGSISQAYQLYSLSNTVTASTTGGFLSSYFNSVKVDTSGATVDDITGYGSLPCDSSAPCLRMHNGGTIQITPYSFNGTSTTNAIRFKIDPDGAYSGTTNGAGKALSVRLYYSGRITSEDNMLNNTCDSAGCWWPSPGQDPSWFSW